jgi:hypothetical protein
MAIRIVDVELVSTVEEKIVATTRCVSTPRPTVKACGSSPLTRAAIIVSCGRGLLSRLLTAAWATGSPRSMASPGDDPVLELVAGLGKAIPPACERRMHSRANARKVIEVPGRPASCKSVRPSPTLSRRPPTRFAEQTARENRSSTAPAHAERAEVGVAEPANPRDGPRHAPLGPAR